MKGREGRKEIQALRNEERRNRWGKKGEKVSREKVRGEKGERE